jgi:hypothetical protein
MGALPSPMIKRPPSYRTAEDGLRGCEYALAPNEATTNQLTSLFIRNTPVPTSISLIYLIW